MGNFFTDQYDLYSSISTNPQDMIVKLRRAVLAATGEDMGQDIKDACVSISEHQSYDSAFEEVEELFKILEEKIGIVGVVQ